MNLVVSAIASELAFLIDQTGATTCSDEIELYWSERYNLLLSPVGIGYLNAALNLQSLLKRRQEVTQVIFCGTAGVYPKYQQEIAIGTLVTAEETQWLDGASELGASRYASLLKKEIYPCESLLFSKLPAVKVATLLGLTASEGLASEISKQGHQVENMELFGIAKVCKRENIRCAAILGVTNGVGPLGHSQWRDHHIAVEKDAGKMLFSLICGGKE